MKTALLPVALLLPSLLQNALAMPVLLETDDVKIIITRPIDQWSSDASKAEDTLDAIKKKRVNYSVQGDDGKTLISGPLSIFKSRSGITDPSEKRIDVALQQWDVDYTHQAWGVVNIARPFTVDPAQMAEFIKSENRLFGHMILVNEDPSTAAGRTTGKKVFGGILSAGLTVLSMATFGLSTGFSVAQGAGTLPTQGMGDAVGHFGNKLAPEPLPDTIDFSGYKQIDIRPIRMGTNDRMGQMVFAYKVDKTPENEEAALEKAIPHVFGVDTPLEEIVAARDADFKHRQTIWDQCVADKECS